MSLPTGSSRRFLARLAGALLVVSAVAWAAQTPAISANQLVRETVQRRLRLEAARTDRFLYRMRKVTPARTEVRQYVETDLGTVGRLLSLNDQPLSPDLAAREDARLQNLATHPELQRDRQARQKDDEQRATRMVAALPDAFNYAYDGTEPSPQGELIRLRFEPNPKFDPPTRELKIYQGMKGQMWLRVEDHHMVRMTAALFRDVEFGWGILGRLYQGGRFEIAQHDVGEGRWEVTHMVLDFTGRLLLIKSLRIKNDQTLSDFHRVPGKLTLAQGIDLLRHYEPATGAVAESQPGSRRQPTAQPPHP